ncbi:MAG: polyphosphate polymerase domain-containing protein [Gammaproteobacteria bacterium]|nr:polyphosphate polymerase domain-containing protein [Gammaproteobacteria bacterium]
MSKEKIINVMKRYELKYCMDKDQLEFFKEKIKDYMKVDKYGLTTISSLYYDTINFSLINKSIEKPAFKEKLRLRRYGEANSDSPVFLEIKRKYDRIVYKRRIVTSEADVDDYLYNDGEFEKDQISRELVAFKESKGYLEPKYLIIYDRLAYYQEDSDLRITVDMNPRYRSSDLNLHTSTEGIPLLPEGSAILEVKVQHSVPLWLSKILSEGKIYKTSFSKVGTAHTLEMKKSLLKTKLEKQVTKGEYQYGFTI